MPCKLNKSLVSRFFTFFFFAINLDNLFEIRRLAIAVVTLQTYLGHIHQKSPEVNSSRVLFYIGEKFWEGHTTDIGTKVFTPVEFFGV